MKEYDLIVIGTGSVMNIVDAMLLKNPNVKIAVIDKDEPGGICLTRGCIPSKILLYPAELLRILEQTEFFGIDLDIKKVNFQFIMDRMRKIIYNDINAIRRGLSASRNIDYFPIVAEFVAPYTLKVGNEIIKSNLIILCTGSKPQIPLIKGLESVDYHTSDTVLKLNKSPKTITIIGGGYIAAEYGHFFSAMGAKVTIVGRNPQFLPDEEPEISALVKKELQLHMEIIINHEVRQVEKTLTGEKKLVATNMENGKNLDITSDEILIATGRAPNADVLHPERGGIKVDNKGWIIVNEYLETSQPNVWAIGDAIGRYQFKHVANYESKIVYYNAILKGMIKADYHAIPHAVFTYPEIASVGLREKEAIERYSKEKVLIGIKRYEDTAKGEAMNVNNCFVKVIVEEGTMKILGAHIVGPHASVLIQEIVNLMYTSTQSAEPIIHGMHIHPALSEVVEGALNSLMPSDQYHHVIEHHYNLPSN